MEENNNINPINNLNNTNEKPKSKYRITLIIITIIVLLLSLYGKLITIGWLTCFLCWIPIIPGMFSLFTVAGITVSNLKDRKTIDYVLYIISCVTILLFSYTFEDVGDTESQNRIVNLIYSSIDSNTLFTICFVSFIINIVISITLILKSSKKVEN